ncbi:MAG TPA: hypothetical protein V6C78_32320 [Crinalium sp.]|jgi:hypothetical protein
MKATISSSSQLRSFKHDSIRKWAKIVSCTLEKIGQELFQYLAGNPELRIHKTVNSQGMTYWRIYDPVTQRNITLSSEQEVRTWIENRYS